MHLRVLISCYQLRQHDIVIVCSVSPVDNNETKHFTQRCAEGEQNLLVKENKNIYTFIAVIIATQHVKKRNAEKTSFKLIETVLLQIYIMKNNEKYVNIEVVVCIKRTSLQRRIAGARQATGLGLSTNDRRGLRIIRRASLHRGRSHTVDASEP